MLATDCPAGTVSPALTFRTAIVPLIGLVTRASRRGTEGPVETALGALEITLIVASTSPLFIEVPTSARRSLICPEAGAATRTNDPVTLASVVLKKSYVGWYQ